ncbi:MAG: hypothetical protein R6U96_09280 [Promethearchaeia archaeon]
MPVGLVLMRWDERTGSVVEAKYPEEVKITPKTLMQVYSTHEYSQEAGMISLMVGSLNIASYYTGPEKGYYVLLLLNLDENPDGYEGGLMDIARIILANVENQAYKDMLPSLFQRLSVYPTLNEEQQLAMTYQDEVKRMIINRLREEGVVSKSELMVWLKDKYTEGFIDLEGILSQIITQGCVKQASVKGMPSETIFLTHDLLMMRIPPVELTRDPSNRGLPSDFVDTYRKHCRNFFKDYHPSEEENLKILSIFVEPAVYITIKLLRTAIVTRNELEKLKKKGVDDVDEVLRKLWEHEMIQVYQDEQGNEYYALISDFFIERVFPKYMFRVIKKEYEQKSTANKVLMEYLSILRSTYKEEVVD